MVSCRVDYRADLGKGRLKVLHLNQRKKFRIRIKEDEGGGMTGNDQICGDGCGYYRRLMKDLANFSSRLYTSEFAPGVVNWDGEKLEAFTHSKVGVVKMCFLTIPPQEDYVVLLTGFLWGRKFQVVTDHQALGQAEVMSNRGRLQFQLGEMWG